MHECDVTHVYVSRDPYRVIYGYGYSKGGPEGRMAGGLISHLGDIPLVFTCLKVAYDLM